ATLQTELRTPVVWRFGVAAFGGLTKVYNWTDRFEIGRVKPNYGGGLRFLIDRKNDINLRLDYARGSDGQDGFYVAFGESF
ncbi:MAG TPA: polymerase, partial [Anseongella sp.]|nr:polymerase [Anseongella sp.]